jgi:3-oxoacyl-[acyl-carrier protein] reductase
MIHSTETGRRVLVTGSSRGIGANIAASFAGQGDHVALHGRDMTALQQVHNRVTAAGGAASIHTADLTDEGQIAQLFDEVGDVDVLVLNAGGTTTGFGPIETIATDTFRSIVDANLTSVFMTIKAALPRMKERGRGSIITISSTVARNPSARSPAAYAAAKAAVEALTRSLAVQAGPDGIRANCIAPETILTEDNASRIPASIQEQMAAAHPLGRLGTPADVAGLTVFLASDEAAWITGQTINLSGGATFA